jgi:predicted RNA-binding Zn ribbon-like protein
MGKKKRSASNLELIGGRLCLNFANTVSSRTEVPYREYLPTYDELVTWGRHAGILTDDEAATLQIHAARDPDLAADVLNRAIALREAIYRVFWAAADHREPEEADLVVLNTALHRALARLEVRPSAYGFEWIWALGDDGLDQVLWPVARSAADLLTSKDLGRVRKCASEVCDWLFVDASKNRSRRWCMMGVCGSRAKSRRYYRRRKREKASGT